MTLIVLLLAQWLTYSGDDRGTRHSALTEITPANVKALRAVWTFQTGVLGKWESTPLVVDDVVYATGPDNHAWAIDGRTGRTIWRYARSLPPGIKPCCGRVNRGFALAKDKLLIATLDAHLIALDVKTGKDVYDITIDDFRATLTGAPSPSRTTSSSDRRCRARPRAFDAHEVETARAWRSGPCPNRKPGSETWLPIARGNMAADRRGLNLRWS
jgi:alcohol dehydrogenase (cytochrome c)